jgi:hypothetical protein
MSEKFYHISLDVENIIEEFSPQVPTMRYQEEDGTKPRISLSTSIEGCLSGVPWGGRKLESVSTSIFEMTDGEVFCVFRVYEFDRKKIDSKNLILTNKLLNEGLVMDANNSDECWVVNQTIKPIKSYIAVLKSYDEANTDIFSREYYLLEDEEDDDVDFEEYMIGCATKIVNIDYEIYKNKNNIPYKINWEEWYEHLEDLNGNNYEID